MADHSVTPGHPNHIPYPQAGSHTWGEFAGLAVELGGYSDITLVDPYGGSRLWVKPTNPDGTFLEWLAEAVQVAQQIGWPDNHQQ